MLGTRRESGMRKLGRTSTKSFMMLLTMMLLVIPNVSATDRKWIFQPPIINWLTGQSFTGDIAALAAPNVGTFDESLILDQSFDPGGGPNVGWNWVQYHQPIGQSFTPTNPQLRRVDLGLENPSTASVSATLNVRQGTISGSMVGTQVFSVPVQGLAWVSVYFDPSPGVAVVPGMPYVLELVAAGPAALRWYIMTPGGYYAGGTAITDGVPDPNGDYFFKTFGLASGQQQSASTFSINRPATSATSQQTTQKTTASVAPNETNLQLPLILLLAFGVGVGSAIAILNKRKRVKPAKSQAGGYCTNCRAKLRADAEFCGECGYSVKAAS